MDSMSGHICIATTTCEGGMGLEAPLKSCRASTCMRLKWLKAHVRTLTQRLDRCACAISYHLCANLSDMSIAPKRTWKFASV
eukprot:5820689-Amphidinium_carterae.1